MLAKNNICMLLFLWFSSIHSEWIELPQLSLNKPHSSALLSDAASTIKTTVQPIKYEDLQHIIGPGFEDELEQFYHKHKQEIDKEFQNDSGKIKRFNSNLKNNINKKLKYESGVGPIVSDIAGDELTLSDPWGIYDLKMNNETSHPTQDPWSKFDRPPLNKIEYKYLEHDRKLENISFTSQIHSSAENVESVNADKNVSSVENHKQSVTTKITQPKRVIKLIKYKAKSDSSLPLSFGNFLEYLKDIQNSFITSTSRTIQYKIKILENFKDELLRNIEQRIKSLWPVTKVTRVKRSYVDHHVDFPSSEAALMTISFLTFAVFLIKLVLQVINTIKSKHYSYNSFDTSSAAMTAVNVIKRNRNARKLSVTEDHDALNAIRKVTHQ